MQQTADKLHLAAADAQKIGGWKLKFIKSSGFGIRDGRTEINMRNARPVQCCHAHGARLTGGGDDTTFQQDLTYL